MVIPEMWWPLILLAITGFVWASVLNLGLTNWDDEGYILKNNLLKLPFPSLDQHFKNFVMGNYHPLTTLSLHWDSVFWKSPVWGYHFTNGILHLINTLLVFFWLKNLKGTESLAWVAALIFGIHPLHVESVAWVSERKDVLYSMFYLAALWVQTLYLKDKVSFFPYAGASIVLFLLSVLSKGVAVTLAPVFFLNLWYYGKLPHRKEWLVPGLLLLLALIFGYVAIQAQQSSDSIKTLDETSWLMRPIYALYAIGAYVGKTLIPLRLSNFYPYPETKDLLLWLVAFTTVLGVSALVWFRNRISTTVWWGLGFLLLQLGPILQLLPVGEALYADRYMYLGLAGLFPALVFLIPENLRSQKLALGVLVVWLVGLGYWTRQRIPVWKDSLALWNDMIQKYPEGYFVAYNNRAIIYHEKGNYPEALRDFDKAISMYAQYTDAYYNRGTSKAAIGDKEGAIADFTAALEINPKFHLAWYNRGNAFAISGKMEEAERDYLKAVHLKPDYAEAWTNLGNVYGVRKESKKAEEAYSHSINLNPQNAQAYNNRALSRVALGDTLNALKDFETAIGLYEANGNKASADESRRNQALMIPGSSQND